MTVKELIELLNKYPLDMQVCYEHIGSDVDDPNYYENVNRISSRQFQGSPYKNTPKYLNIGDHFILVS